MTEEQKKKLEQKLWDIASELRGRMDADEFRDYILGFIFYKYLSERLHIYVDQELLKSEDLAFAVLHESDQMLMVLRSYLWHIIVPANY